MSSLFPSFLNAAVNTNSRLCDVGSYFISIVEPLLFAVVEGAWCTVFHVSIAGCIREMTRARNPETFPSASNPDLNKLFGLLRFESV
jgi:hypothetical protein